MNPSGSAEEYARYCSKIVERYVLPIKPDFQATDLRAEIDHFGRITFHYPAAQGDDLVREAILKASTHIFSQGFYMIEFQLSDGFHLEGLRQEVRRPAPGRLLGAIRWVCSAESRETIDLIRADLARDAKEMAREGRSATFIRGQQVIVVSRETVGLLGRFILRFLQPVADLVGRVWGPARK
jgi:hypothetical protein